MKFFEMEFCVDDVPVYVTEPYDNVAAVLDEVTTERDSILQYLAGRTDGLDFDKEKAPDSAENEKAVEAFDYWLSDIVLHGFENQEFDDQDCGVKIVGLAREVKQLYSPKARNADLVPAGGQVMLAT